MEEQKKQGIKRAGQKFKSLLVWDILQKRTDENHALQRKEIVEHLNVTVDIPHWTSYNHCIISIFLQQISRR